MDSESTREGRRHKGATSTEGILADVQASIDWLRQALESCDQPLRITLVGFCFGGHAALLTSTLADVHVSLDFYGAGVSHARPGGGAPNLELLPSVKGELHLKRRSHRPELALQRLCVGADHGFMWEARDQYHQASAEEGWRLLLEAAHS